jgi:hypothetical protein
VELSVDNSDAVHALLNLAHGLGAKEQLAFVEQQLIRQVVLGDSLLSFWTWRAVIPPDALLRSLRQAHTERPDLWHAWSALVRSVTWDNLLTRDKAREATRKFPHLPESGWTLPPSSNGATNPTKRSRSGCAFEINPA